MKAGSLGCDDPERDDGDLEQGICRKGDEKWSISGYVLKVQLTGFAIDDCIVRGKEQFHQGQWVPGFLFSTTGSIRLLSTDGNGYW